MLIQNQKEIFIVSLVGSSVMLGDVDKVKFWREISHTYPSFILATTTHKLEDKNLFLINKGFPFIQEGIKLHIYLWTKFTSETNIFSSVWQIMVLYIGE